MKFDIQSARQMDDIAVWASQQKGRLTRLGQRMNKLLARPVSMRSVPNWFKRDKRKRSEPSYSSGLALLAAFKIEAAKELPRKGKSGPGSAGADESAAPAAHRDSKAT